MWIFFLFVIGDVGIFEIMVFVIVIISGNRSVVVGFSEVILECIVNVRYVVIFLRGDVSL